MTMAQRNNIIIKLAIGLVLLCFIIASFSGWDSLWGVNHLRFLPLSYTIAFFLISVLILIIWLWPNGDNRARKIIDGIDRLLWSKSKIARLVLTLSLIIPFFIFRVKAPLLGDSLTWLGIFSHGESYILKWAEPGAILILRNLQNLLGGYSHETALMAFQIMSITSGVIFIYNIISIIGLICKTALGRFLALTTIFFSGALLLFFGYIEFYPIVWAAVSIFLNLAIRYLENGQNFWVVILAYIICFLMHLQTLYLLPGVAFLIILKAKSKSWRRIFLYLSGLGTIGGVAFLIWLQSTRIEFQVLLLPLFKGRSPAADYAVFSFIHLADILNLIFLVFPCVLALIAIWILYGKKKFDENVSRFLALISAGSLLFLVLFGAAITMGRDWDIMSLSLLAPALLILYQIDRAQPQISEKIIISYSLCAGFMTICFLSTAIAIKPAENRFATLLNARNEAGWVIYANYFLEKGETNRFKEIIERQNEHFPNLKRLGNAYDLLESGRFGEAKIIAQDLAKQEPYNSNYLQILGNLYGKFNQFDSAEEYYNKALRLQPYSTTLMNEIGQLYIKEKQYDKAMSILKKAHSLSPEDTFIIESIALVDIQRRDYIHATGLADTLFITDKNSPGAHLISMIVAINNNDLPSCRYHYNEFRKYGKNRSDYARVIEYYRHLGH
jgi:tetratricopeptide (TPR) repeat protein